MKDLIKFIKIHHFINKNLITTVLVVNYLIAIIAGLSNWGLEEGFKSCGIIMQCVSIFMVLTISAFINLSNISKNKKLFLSLPIENFNILPLYTFIFYLGLTIIFSLPSFIIFVLNYDSSLNFPLAFMLSTAMIITILDIVPTIKGNFYDNKDFTQKTYMAIATIMILTLIQLNDSDVDTQNAIKIILLIIFICLLLVFIHVMVNFPKNLLEEKTNKVSNKSLNTTKYKRKSKYSSFLYLMFHNIRLKDLIAIVFTFIFFMILSRTILILVFIPVFMTSIENYTKPNNFNTIFPIDNNQFILKDRMFKALFFLTVSVIIYGISYLVGTDFNIICNFFFLSLLVFAVPYVADSSSNVHLVILLVLYIGICMVAIRMDSLLLLESKYFLPVTIISLSCYLLPLLKYIPLKKVKE